MVDLFEVRIDLIGKEWQQVARSLDKPWIACNRIAAEGGKWTGNEARRIEQLLQATELGAEIIDVELSTKNLKNIIHLIKKSAECLLSCHDIEKTSSFDSLKGMVRKQLEAGADICKVVTTALNFEDNLALLQLIREFPDTRLVTFAMGPLGGISRVLCPLVGGDFMYASMEKGKESAPGQITVKELVKIYGMVRE